MLCRKCNYILKGDEAFCPHCGQATKTQEENQQLNNPIENSSDISSKDKCSIFDNDGDEEEIKEEKKPKRSKAAFNIIALFVFILIVIAAFTAVQYFDLAPAISSLIDSAVSSSVTEEAENDLSEKDFDIATGLIYPDINYKPVQYIVSSHKPLSLRKGPGDTYAALTSLAPGTRLQITGGSVSSDTFVYVYVPSEDVYGWLNASYLSETSLQEKTSLSGEKPAESTTADSTTKNEEEPSPSPQKRTAKITAEKGLYLRVGPGVDFEAVTVIGKDEEVTLIEVCQSDPSWIYVQFGKDKGYVSRNYISEI